MKEKILNTAFVVVCFLFLLYVSFQIGRLYEVCQHKDFHTIDSVKEDFAQGREFILFQTYKLYPAKGTTNRWYYSCEVKE